MLASFSGYVMLTARFIASQRLASPTCELKHLPPDSSVMQCRGDGTHYVLYVLAAKSHFKTLTPKEALPLQTSDPSPRIFFFRDALHPHPPLAFPRLIRSYCRVCALRGLLRAGEELEHGARTLAEGSTRSVRWESSVA
eukprot:scaffold260785_cov31-Tisochrysis_lutea.AAC.3